MAKYLSGRVKRVPQSELTADRYQALALNQAEPNLGDPSLYTQTLPIGVQQQLVSVIGYPGQRYWIPVSGISTIGGISIYDENIIVPTNAGVGSITQINFVGAAISAKGYLNLDGSPGIGVTITVFSPGSQGQVIFNNNNDFKGASSLFYDNSTNYVGIGTTIPTQELDINGDLRLRGTIYDYNNQPGNNNETLVKNNFGGLTWINQSAIRAGAGGTITNIQYHNSLGLVDGASDFVFDYTNNRVGIGTTIPSVKLDVIGSANISGNTKVNSLNINTTGIGEGDLGSNGGTDGIFVISNTTNSGIIALLAKNSSGTLNNTITLNSSSATINGSLTVAGDTQFDGNVKVGISTTSNYIAFRGTYDDNQTPYTHTFIGERIYESGTEKSELLLFKGNDPTNTSTGPGPDRIRLAAGEFRFDTYYGVAASGTFEQVATSANITNKMILTGDGNLGIGTTVPTSKLYVSGDSLITGVSTFGSNVLPSGANQNIGSESQKWDYVYANNFSGAVTGNANTASQIAAITRSTNATHYLTFVDSDNSPVAYENLYTNSGVTYNPSTGNLGIGTTNPSVKLDVNGNAIISGIVTVKTLNINTTFPIESDSTGGDLNSSGGSDGIFGISNTTNSGSIYLSARNSSGTLINTITLNSSSATVNGSLTVAGVGASVGIGTDNPSEKLSVYGAVESLYDTIGEGGQFVLRGKTGTPIRWNIDNYSVGVNTNLFRIFKEDNSTAGANGRVYVGITTIGEFIIGDSAGALSPTGTANQQLQVQSGAYIQNNLGIGTDDPSDPLDVNGNIRVRSGLKDFYGTVGAAGSILTVVGAGDGVRWTTPYAAGLQGLQGTQGVQGLQGTQGTQGLQGTQGTQGTQGVQGVQGTTGTATQGTQGTQGLQGIQGTTGTATQGTQGTTGTATQGTQGTTGTATQGTQGTTGTATQGTQGTTGTATQGTQGLQGLQGTQGTQGVQGLQGLQGTQGTQGVQGLQGLQGTEGTQGTQGTTGTATQGTQGTTGTATQGTQGTQGTTGTATQGTQGTQGTIGPVAGSSNQVLYKNASNDATTSANFTFDGSSVGVTGNTTITNGDLYITTTDDVSGDIFANGGTDGIFVIFNTTNSGTINLAPKDGAGNYNPILSLTSGTATVNGALNATGDITAFASDERLKENIQPLENALDKVLTLNGFTYNFNETGQSLGFDGTVINVGVSAQQVQAVLPEAVKPAPVDSNYLTVQYEKLVPLLIEAIKGQQEIIANLQNRLEILEGK